MSTQIQITPSSGITIGTTPISNGAAGRILFQWSGPVVQQDSNFIWDNTNKRLGVGVSLPQARLDVKAQGVASTDIAFRVRNSGDTRDIFNVRGNKTIEFLADTPATNGGISITASAYNEPIINMYDSFGSKKLIIDTPNALIGVGGSGNIKIGSLTTTNSYLGLVTPTTNNRFLKLVDAFGSEYLSLGGNSYDGGGGISMTLKTTTNNGTNFVTFSRSNNTNPFVINDQARVGIGTSSPAARLDVSAQGALSTDIAFRVRNSADTANIITANGKGQVWSNGGGLVASNTAYGELALNANTTGAQNTAFGYKALTTATTANANTAIGWGSLQLTTGLGNTAIGQAAGQLNAGGAYNTYLGYVAGQYGTTAVGGIFIGYAAGQSSNATRSICIGYTAGVNAGNGSIALGYNSGPGTGTHNLSIGEGAGLGMTTGSINMHLGYRTVASGVTTGNYNTLIGGSIVVGNVSNNAVLADMQGNQAIKKDANHNVVLGTEVELATNATNGFAYFPTCAGVPTGVPSASFTGKAPIVIDSTNNKMYIYTNATWVALN